MNRNDHILHEYEQARSGAYYVKTAPGCMHIEGPDQVQFLQRQTTNDITRLTRDNFIITVLTTPAARILDVLTVFMDDHGLVILSLPGYGAKTVSYMKSRIFFMDKVTLSDKSLEIAEILVDGPMAGTALVKSGITRLPNFYEIVPAEVAGCTLQILGVRGVSGAAYSIVISSTDLQAVQTRLMNLEVHEIQAQSYHILRVEAGLPSPGAELTEDYTPLEVNLEAYISQRKGCYTGQEVIARQINYEKVTQHLVGVRLASPAQPGDAVHVEGRPVGKVTSAAISPRFGPIALAVIRRPYHHPEEKVDVLSSDSSQCGIVTSLPFEPEGE